MLQWISDHSEVLQVVLNAIMVAVWMLYLQVFLSGFRRQRRSEILITYGGGVGAHAGWFVANLGLEPIFIMDVLIQLETDDGVQEVAVTERTGHVGEPGSLPEATNHGPLVSGSFMCIGSRETIFERVREETGRIGQIRSITILVTAATAASRSLVGASRSFRFVDGSDALVATTIDTHQIVRRRGINNLKRKLARNLP